MAQERLTTRSVRTVDHGGGYSRGGAGYTRRMLASPVRPDAALPANDYQRNPLEGAAVLVGSWALIIGTFKLIHRAGRHDNN